MDLEEGMHIIGVGSCDGKDIERLHGKIVDISSGTPPIGIEFESWILRGHSCGGRGRKGHCWYVHPENIKILPIDNKQSLDFLYKY